MKIIARPLMASEASTSTDRIGLGIAFALL